MPDFWLLPKFYRKKVCNVPNFKWPFFDLGWPCSWINVFHHKGDTPSNRLESDLSFEISLKSKISEFSFFSKTIKKVWNLFFNFYFSKKSNQSSNIRLCHLIGCWRNRTWLVNLIFERKRLKYRPIRCQDFFFGEMTVADWLVTSVNFWADWRQRKKFAKSSPWQKVR